jgi:hypothetical protein
VITIVADAAPAGKVFDRWVVVGGGSLADESAARTEFTVPDGPATVSATWRDAPVVRHLVTVEGGSVDGGGSEFAAGEVITIVADAAPAGKVFDRWVVVGGGSLADESAARTEFTVPDGPATVRATWKDAPPTVVLVTAIAVTGGDAINTPGGTLQLTAEVSPADATDKTVVWSVESGTVSASVSASGLVTALADGEAVIRASAQDGSGVHGEATIAISGQEDPPEPVVYAVLEHFGTWTGEGAANAKVDADVSKFTRLTRGGVEVPASDYTVAEGSTVIILKAEHLGTLVDGSYSYVAEFADGVSDAIGLVVDRPDDPDDDKPGDPDDDKPGDPGDDKPGNPGDAGGKKAAALPLTGGAAAAWGLGLALALALAGSGLRFWRRRLAAADQV